MLRSLGFKPQAAGGYQRLQIEETGYSYLIDLSPSKSGEWVVGMAHLATIADLTKVPAQPLLALLSTNDTLLGMYFSYEKVNGRIMLNAAVPARALDQGALRSLLAEMQATVRKTEGLWDTRAWAAGAN